MYSIFRPLDAGERLPRELVMEARRHRPLGRPELAGILWPATLFGALWAAGSLHLAGLAAVVGIAIVLGGLAVFGLSGRRA